MNTLSLTRSAFDRLVETVGSLPAESGAVIGAEHGHPELISRVWFDQQAGWGNRFYTPSKAGLFHRGELSLFRMTLPGDGKHPQLEQLSVTVISAD